MALRWIQSAVVCVRRVWRTSERFQLRNALCTTRGPGDERFHLRNPGNAIATRRRNSSTTSSASTSSSSSSSSANNAVVYIYGGPGTTEISFRHMEHSLSRCLSHSVLPIGPDNVIQGQWMENCAAIVFGGGNATDYVQALGDRGLRNVRDYVLGGGTYVGVCAGAYLACDLVIFQQRGQPDLIKTRPLKFYPGICYGPVNRDYNPTQKPNDGYWPVTFRMDRDDVMDGHDVTLRHNNVTVNAYVNGGGVFLPDCRQDRSEAPSVDVLACYESHNHALAAIVKCEVGRGVAILSSPHLEMTSYSDDVTAEECWRAVLKQGNLQTRAAILDPGWHRGDVRRVEYYGGQG